MYAFMYYVPFHHQLTAIIVTYMYHMYVILRLVSRIFSVVIMPS